MADGHGTRNLDPAKALPYPWDKQHNTEGTAQFKFHIPRSTLKNRCAILLPRIGSTYKVWLDDQLLEDQDTGKRYGAAFSFAPRMVGLPVLNSTGLGASEVEKTSILRIEIHAIPWTQGGLVAVLIGPYDEVRAAWSASYEGIRFPALAVAIITAVLGLFGWVLWWYQREVIYLAYAVAESLWSWRTFSAFVWDVTWIPATWWGFAAGTSLSFAIAACCTFVLAATNLLRRPWSIVIGWHCGVSFAALLAMVCFPLISQLVMVACRTATLLLTVMVAVVLIRNANRVRTRESVAFAGCLLILITVGAHDLVLVTLPWTLKTTLPWLTYVWPLFGATVAWWLANRLHRTLLAQKNHPHEMRLRLRAQEQVLAQHHEKRQAQAVQRGAIEERKRVLQDMHDGVGHELLGALQMARDGGSDGPGAGPADSTGDGPLEIERGRVAGRGRRHWHHARAAPLSSGLAFRIGQDQPCLVGGCAAHTGRLECGQESRASNDFV